MRITKEEYENLILIRKEFTKLIRVIADDPILFVRYVELVKELDKDADSTK